MIRPSAVFAVFSLVLLAAVQPAAVAELRVPGEVPHKQGPDDAEFGKLLIRAQWTWQHKPPFTPHPIVFRSDGTVEQFHGWTAKWAISGDCEVTVTYRGQTAILHFDREVTKFRGTDFDGQRAIWGELIQTKSESA